MKHRGRMKYCRLYDTFLVKPVGGWTQRCDQCLEEFPVDADRANAESKERETRFITLAEQLKSAFNRFTGKQEDQ
jgi:hypothetical protein